MPAMGVYLHQDQLQTALTKSEPCVSSRNKFKGTARTKRDGKRVGRYLLNVFYSQEQLARSSVIESEQSQYPALDRQIVDAIIGEFHNFKILIS